jgi:gliding motility-associated-like protein
MIKNYTNLNKILKLKKAICLFFIFFVFSQIANAQCASPVVGCPNTDLTNFGIDSNNDATTIEYDNFVSSWHTTVVRTSDGSFQVWGEKIAPNGANNVLAPLTINATNFTNAAPGIPAIPLKTLAGTPLKVALGSSSSDNVQGILLATDGLYAWSKEGAVLADAITSSTEFQKLTIDGNTNGLPSGVTPGDVKMMFATYMTLAITTCSGDVWVISQTEEVRGNGGGGSATKWYRVTTSAPGNPFLTDVVACRGNTDGLMALKSDGTVYVWGINVLLGNNTAIIGNQNRAVQMTMPTTTPKMIGSTGSGTARSYYVLSTDGNLYAVGENSKKELGDWTTNDRLGWVQPHYDSKTGPVMNNIKWFSSQEHDAQYGSMNVINSSKNLFAFGNSNGYLLGKGNTSTDPTTPNGTDIDNILAVETGGHTSMIVKKCEAKFGYVGHRISGSMGDGTNASTNEQNYTFATAAVQICGVESIPVIQPISTGGGPGSKYCVGDPVLLEPSPTGGTLSILSGPGTLTGNTLSFTGAGTVEVQYSVATDCGGTSVTTKSFEAALCPLDLQVIKVVDNLNPGVGNNSVFTITATNNGPYKATGVTVNDVLPSGYTFVSATPSTGTWTAPDWTVGNLINGASATLSIVATVNASGSYANTATITGNDPDINLLNNTDTVTPVVQTNLTVTKAANVTVPNVGDNITFTITASNAGPSNATGVTVSDALPSGYTFVSATPSTGTWLAPNWTIGNLANGATATLSVIATVNAAGSYTNTATITGLQNDPTSGNNSGSSTPAVNHFPAANDDDRTGFPLNEDGADGTVNILTNDTDADGNPTVPLNGVGQFTLDLDPAVSGIQTTYSDTKGDWSLDTTTGIVTFNPADNFNGTATITYTLCDAAGLCNNADITFLVNSVNDNPIAVDDLYTINEDDAVILDPFALDSDLDGDALSITSIGGTALTGGAQIITVTNGTVEISTAGVITFTPSAGFNSTTPVSIPYIISDGHGGTATANQLITVNSVNDIPTAVEDSYSVNEDDAVTLDPLALDSDLDGDTLNITSINGTALTGGAQTIPVTNGTVNISASGVITFTPSANFNSTTPVSIFYEISDGHGGNAMSNELITVNAVNDIPTAVSDSYTVNEDTAVTLNPLALDSDFDGDALSITSIGGTALTGGAQIITVTDGTVDISAVGVITFAPSVNFNSATPVRIPYEITDGHGGSATANELITVNSVNDNPTAVNDSYSINEDTAVTLNPLALDSDLDGDTLSITSIGGTVLTGTAQTITVTNGTVNISAAKVITFTPSADFNSTTPVSIPYIISDGHGGTATANQVITVNAVNDNPTAVNDSYSVNEDTAVILEPLKLDSDLDGNTLSITSIDGTVLTGGTQSITVTNGTVNISAAGVITFTPSANFNSAIPVSIPYLISDGNGGTATANQLITVNAVNDNPIAADYINASILSTAGATAINALAATDIDGTISNYTVTSLPAHGTLALGGVAVTAGQVLTPAQVSNLTYDPIGTFTGDDTFTFTATDNLNAVSTTATITIPVGNNTPVANADTNTVIPSTSAARVIKTLTAADTDGTIASYTVASLPAHGTLALGGVAVTAGQVLTPAQVSNLTYDPVGTFTGNDTFTFTATDNLNAVSTAATVTIPVGNNTPVANADTNTVIPSTSAATAIKTLTAADTDGTIASYTVASLPSHGTLALAGVAVTASQVLTPTQVANLTYDPIGTFTGDDTFTFTATDNLNAVSTAATVTIPVGNNIPVANNNTNTVIPSTSAATAINVLNATDTDGTIASYIVASLPSHGTLALGGVAVTAGQVLTLAEVSNLTYDPIGTFTGNDTFTFTATDNLNAVSTAATVTIPVGNNTPVANNDTNTVIPSTSAATAIKTLTAADTDGTIASYTVTSLPAHGTLALAGVAVTAGQILTPAQVSNLTYDPVGTFTGNDTFTFTATDNLNAVSTAATVTIPVGNNTPVANNDTNAVIPSTSAATAIKTLTAADTDGTITSYTVVSLPAHGTLAIGGVAVTAGQVLTPAQVSNLTYDPVGTFTGNDTFTFTATDNLNAVSTAATITIPVGNNTPVANNDTNAVIPSTSAATAIKTLTAADTDGTIASYTVASLPSHGTLALAGVAVTAGQVLTPTQVSNLTYDPVGTFTGNDTFTFTATDNLNAVSTAATVTIPVGNNTPVANNDTNTVIPSTSAATAIKTLTAADTDGTIASYTVTSLPAHGTLALAGVAVTAGQVLTPAQVSNLTYDPIGTFTGNDTFTFTATDNLNAVSTAGTITIPVGNNAPVANDDDTNAAIPSRAGATAINALSATDTDGTIVNYTISSLPTNGTLALSGRAIAVNEVLTPLEVSMLTYDPNGAFSGNETFTFTATDNNGSIDATPATITIVIEKTIVNAVADPINSVVGIDKTVTVVNVFDNDTLNNNPLIPADVNLHIPIDPTGTMTLKTDGTVELIPNAPPGTYTFTYEICEKANSSNCSSATVSVTVVAPTMTITANSYCSNNTPYVSYNVVADNFTPTGLLTINWIDSANNIVATQNNMPLSGNVLWPGAVVDGNNKTTDWPGWVLVNGQWIQGNDGFELTRPSVTMQFTLNPTQSVVVNYPSAASGCSAMPTFGIQAGNEDDVTLADGINGSLEAINVLDNDTLNGVPAKPSDVILKGLDLPEGITLNPDGTIDVAPGTKGGDYTLNYQICEAANSSNCSTATVKIFVEVPAIAIVKTVVLNDDNGNGYAEVGETLTYNFAVTNKGNVDLENITVSDPLPGIVMSGGPISLKVGESDDFSITGTYTLSQEDVNSGSISNQATVAGITKSGISVLDKSDFSNTDGEKPTVLELSGCVIKIFNAVSANGDNQNERFYIQGLECYPDNTVQIFNRWGVLVFEREHYNNADIAFRGVSEGRVTIKDSNGLPEGTYYYIIRYKDKQSNLQQEAGYLYLTK